MTHCRRLGLGASLVAALCSLASVALSLDVESLKLIAGELPFPNLNFELGVTFSVRETALLGLGDPREALAAADERLAAESNDAEAHLRRGMALEALRQEGSEDEYSRAAELWKAMVDRDPENVEAQVGLAKVQVQMDKLDEAAPLIEELAADHPDLWWPHYALARRTMDEFLEGVDWSDLSKVGPAAEAEGDDPAAFRTRAQQVADTALLQIDDALKASPGEPAARMLRVLVQAQLALWSAVAERESSVLSVFGKASDELREVARDCPGEPQVQLFARWTTITRVLSRVGGGDLSGLWHRLGPEDRQRLAEDELATDALVAEEAGRIPDAYELLAVYAMLHGDDTEGLARLKDSTQQDPTSPERWEAYIGAVTRTGDLDRIEAAIREAMQHIDNGKLRAALAKVHQKRGEGEKAEQELAAAIELDDGHAAFARLMLGILRLKRGDAEAAADPLHAVVGAWAADGSAEAALAVALALLGRQDEAAEHIRKAREMEPDVTLYARAAEIIGP